MKRIVGLSLVIFLLAAVRVEGKRVIRAAEHAEKTGRYIVKLQSETTRDVFKQTLEKARFFSDDSMVYVKNEGVYKFFVLKLSEESTNKVKELESVEYLEEEIIVHSAQYQSTSWALDRIDQRDGDLDGIYDPGQGRDGEGVDIYILDTGIQYDHLEFGGRARYPGFDPMDDEEFTNQQGADCHGHGTAVASVAAGNHLGVAKKATIYSVRVVNCSAYGPSGVVINGIDLAVEAAKNSRRPSVISISLAGPNSTAINGAVQAATDAGVPVVVAAGNNRSDACAYSPASAPSAITVGGTAKGDRLYNYTNGGSCVDIFAPGESVLVAYFGSANNTRLASGTSISAPIVSGVLAIYLQERYFLRVEDLTQFLIDTSVKDILNLGILSDVGLAETTPNRLVQVRSACVRGIDLVFLLDSSGSIGWTNFELIKEFVISVTFGLDIGPNNTQVAVIKYSTIAYNEIHLNEYDNEEALLQAISRIQYIAGGTSTHLGLKDVLAEFNNFARPVEETFPRVAFVLTDGHSYNFDETILAAMELHRANIEVYAVAIGDNVNDAEMSAIATTDSNVLNTDLNVEQLKELQEILVSRACKANLIALVGQVFRGTLQFGEVAYFVYDLPEEGFTLSVEALDGYVVMYVSTKDSNPNEAMHEFKLVTYTTESVFIPPWPLDSPANGTVKVFVSIEGRSSLNRFVLNTTYNDTTNRSACVRGIDLVYLLDSSGSIGPSDFELIKDFVISVTDGLVIGPNNTQVAVIKYSTSVHTEFHLNEYSNEEALLQAISRIQYITGGTSTHLGLKAVLDEFNNFARPVEQTFPRVAFVLTDGHSSDFDETILAAMELHRANIEVYAVAIGNSVDAKEISAIATTDNHILSTDIDVEQLRELQKILVTRACQANLIAIVGQVFHGTLELGEVAYFVYDLPEEGFTLSVVDTEGCVVIYVSTQVSNPNEEMHDLKLVTNTTISVFISPSQLDSPANDTAKVYISIEGCSPSNRFVLNTTYNDTTTPPEPLKIKFVKDSPIVSGNNMTAFIHANQPVSDMKCRMSGTKEVKNCTNGYVQFTGLPKRDLYTLKVVAKTEEGATALITREFRIEKPGYCTAHLINEGVSVEGQTVKVEFTPTSDTQSTACILNPPKTEDKGFFSCTNPVVIKDLPPGPHMLKITPKGCGEKRKPLRVHFEV